MLSELIDRSATLPGAPGVRCVETDADGWHALARDAAAAGARLLALWANPGDAYSAVLAAYLCDSVLLVAQLRLPAGETAYRGIADVFPAAARMQRAAADLTGLRARDADTRPWLRHAAWPASHFPLAAPRADHRSAGTPPPDRYPFVRVAGDGVHEIAVGPVHAGIIEPGHFRFSVVGEKVLKLEERLGYAHKGIERLFAST
jgi:Ni,Fe-hydrogenase III component G